MIIKISNTFSINVDLLKKLIYIIYHVLYYIIYIYKYLNIYENFFLKKKKT